MKRAIGCFKAYDLRGRVPDELDEDIAYRLGRAFAAWCMPRRVADYTDQFATLNLIISIASFALGLSMLVFVYNIVASWRGGARAPANPWRALTLEWQVSSPPPIFNFDRVPTVVGGPYEYGVPGAVHGIFKSPAEAGKTPAKAMAP